jgi:hypothetical protein
VITQHRAATRLAAHDAQRGAIRFQDEACGRADSNGGRERLKIHDVVLEGIDLALRRVGIRRLRASKWAKSGKTIKLYAAAERTFRRVAFLALASSHPDSASPPTTIPTQHAPG